MTLTDFETNRSDFNELKQLKSDDFELRTIFSFIRALEPKKTEYSIDETPKIISEENFSPTLRNPDIIIADRMNRDFSIWFKPVIYLPKQEKTVSIMPEFLFFFGNNKCIYNLDTTTEKAITTHDFLTTSVMKEMSVRLLSRINSIALAVFVRKKYSNNDLNEIKDVGFFLKPAKMLVISEEYLPESFKMNLPFNASFVENVDMNTEKLREMARRIF